MKIERVEKIVPLGLILIFAILIAIRASNVLHFSFSSGFLNSAVAMMTSAGLEAVAGIFAIVISISLMAVQHASQEYTHRILKGYVTSLMFWSLTATYLGTMTYNLYFVGSMKNTASILVVDVSILLQILCFLMLIPHFIITTAQLNPNYIINKTLRTVNQSYMDGLERYYQNGRMDVPGEIDRILPVVEIVEKAVIKGDRDTTRSTLIKLYDRYKEYTRNGEPVWVRQYFMDYLLRIGQKGIQSQDNDIATRIIKIFGEIAESACCDEAVDYIDILAIAALKNDYDATVQQAIDSFLLPLKAPLKPEAIDKIFNMLGELAVDLLTLEKQRITSYLLQQVGTVANAVVDTNRQVALGKCTQLLERIGLIAAQRKLTNISRNCILAFHKIGTIAVAQGMVAEEESILNSLLKVEQATPVENREIRSQIDYVVKDIRKYIHKPSPGKDEKASLDISDLWDED